MTKEITKAIILQQIQDRLKLRDYIDEKFLFSETVMPIFDIERLTQVWLCKDTTNSIIATGGSLFFTVPDNEKWYLRRYDIFFMGVSTITVAGAYMTRTSGSFCYLDLEGGQNVSYHTELHQHAVLEPGERLYVSIDGYTSTMDLRMTIDYMKEEIR